jgi:hypothetical protein
MLRDVYAQTAGTNTARRYAFDILIVDDAHHVAPASPSTIGGGRGYAIDTILSEHARFNHAERVVRREEAGNSMSGDRYDGRPVICQP